MLNIIPDIFAYHDENEGPSERVLEEYGMPVRSLYTGLNPGDLHQKIEVKDEMGQVLYWTKSSVFTLFGKTDIMDEDGNLVAHLEKRPVSLHEKHFITMADGRQFTLSNELFHVVDDVTNIEELDWQIRGDAMGLSFMLFDREDAPIAAIGHKLISIHDRYSIDIYQTQYEKTVVVVVIALQKMLAARQESNKG